MDECLNIKRLEGPRTSNIAGDFIMECSYDVTTLTMRKFTESEYKPCTDMPDPERFFRHLYTLLIG